MMNTPDKEEMREELLQESRTKEVENYKIKTSPAYALDVLVSRIGYDNTIQEIIEHLREFEESYGWSFKLCDVLRQLTGEEL